MGEFQFAPMCQDGISSWSLVFGTWSDLGPLYPRFTVSDLKRPVVRLAADHEPRTKNGRRTKDEAQRTDAVLTN
jgi:hypothetical protein